MSYSHYLQARQEGDLGGQFEVRKKGVQELLNILEELGSVDGNKAVGYKNDPATLSPQSPYIHGAGGLLSNPGQNPAMLSAMVQPWPGMINAIPRVDTGNIYPTEFDGGYGGEDVPFITTITGVTAGNLDAWANQPSGVCDDPPVAGLLKACTQTASFGRFSGTLRQLDRTRIGRLNNRGETTDFRVLNNLVSDNPLEPEEMRNWPAGDWINGEITARLFEAGMAFQRLIAPLMYTGDPVNNSAAGGRRQFLGFNNIYKTGRVDAFTQVACAAMDSQVINFNANINNTNIFGRYIYQVLEDLYWYLQDYAQFSGLSPVQWVISMDKDLFYALTQIIPVQQYVRVISTMANINTSNKDGGQLHFNGAEVNAMRQDMYNNRYLPLCGERVSVVVEDAGTIGATYTPSTNTRISDIYFHPISVLGSIPVTYWQFFNHANAQGRAYDEMVSKGFTWTSDGGKFLWSSSFRNFCGQISWLTEPRIMSHAPQLGARIQNVAYQVSSFSRSAYPTQSSFFQDGGRTYGTPIVGTPSWSASSTALGVLG